MAGYKETPRQKMIAMMYLVLTALLALNVSKEMLDAFIVVNESVEKTKENFSDKIGKTFAAFEFQNDLQPDKVGRFFEMAKEVRHESEETIRFIDSIKYALIVHTDARIETIEQAKKTPIKDIQAKDRYTEPTRFFFGSDASITHNQPSGLLKARLINYRNKMLSIINEPDTSKRLGLRTEGPYFDANGSRISWEQHNFFYTILAADITLLNKMIAEVQNAEFDVLNNLYSRIDAMDFKFNKIDAKVIPSSSYILQGEEYTAEVFAAAWDTLQDPEVYVLQGITEWNDSYISRAQKLEGEYGLVDLNFQGNEIGTHTYAGVIKVKNPRGEILSYPFSGEFIVAPPSLTVAATKMNVFYIGVDNPVSISVSGLADEKILPRFIEEGGELIKVNDSAGYNYIVRVTSEMKTATITADAQINAETLMNMGSREFRVKRVPTPVAKIASMKEGSIEKNTLLAARAIIPVMEDFEFELYFDITSFSMGTIINGDWIPKRSSSNVFTEEMISIIQNSRRGQKFFFENIQAKGPDGSERTLNSINLTIK